MKLLDIVVEKAVIPDLVATDRDAAIEEIIDAMVSAGALSPELRDEFVKALIRRENRGSTGFGHGVAVPHVKHPAISKMAVAVGISRSGVEFNALDRQPVYSVFLLLSPPNRAGEHIRLLARIARICSSDALVRMITEAHTADEISALIAREDERHVG